MKTRIVVIWLQSNPQAARMPQNWDKKGTFNYSMRKLIESVLFQVNYQSLICRTGIQNYPLDLSLFPSLLAIIKQFFHNFILNLIYI